MQRFVGTSGSDRSLFLPRSPARLVGGGTIAVGGPLLAAVLSVHVLHLVPGLAFLILVALSAAIGRMGAGLFAAGLSAILLFSYGPSSLDRVLDGGGVASVAAFVALGAMVAVGLPRLELAVDTMRRSSERLSFLSGASMI